MNHIRIHPQLLRRFKLLGAIHNGHKFGLTLKEIELKNGKKVIAYVQGGQDD